MRYIEQVIEENKFEKCYKRISIIGGSGTGKTILADNLGKVLNLPVYHIDGINYFKDWEQRNKAERDMIILDKISKSEWIMDGTYTSTLTQRFESSNIIIFLDYSSLAQLKGVLGRYTKNRGKEKQEIPGCKEEISFKFLLWVLQWRKNKRQKILEEIDKVDTKKVLVFKNRKMLNKWFEEQFNEKIK